VGYYYAIVRNMYLRSAEGAVAGGAGPAAGGASQSAPAAGEAPEKPVPATPLVGTALALAVTAVLAVGFLFEPLARLAGLAVGGF